MIALAYRCYSCTGSTPPSQACSELSTAVYRYWQVYGSDVVVYPACLYTLDPRA